VTLIAVAVVAIAFGAFVSPTDARATNGGSTVVPVLFSARIVIYDDNRKPLVDLRLPAGYPNDPTAGQLINFSERIIAALSHAVYWPDRGPLVVRELNRQHQPAFFEAAVVTYRGCTDVKCAEVDLGLPAAYRQNALNARAQRLQYLSDMEDALYSRTGRPAGFGLGPNFPP
jgi:hypothetical protein